LTCGWTTHSLGLVATSEIGSYSGWSTCHSFSTRLLTLSIPVHFIYTANEKLWQPHTCLSDKPNMVGHLRAEHTTQKVCFCLRKLLLHQKDVLPGMASKLLMVLTMQPSKLPA